MEEKEIMEEEQEVKVVKKCRQTICDAEFSCTKSKICPYFHTHKHTCKKSCAAYQKCSACFVERKR